jgi:molybdopterin converting factor subunit 1
MKSMTIRVKLFAVAKERAARDELELELPSGATIADLRAAIESQHPQLAAIIPCVMWAVDKSYANNTTPLTPNSEVALIPPVSGG